MGTRRALADPVEYNQVSIVEGETAHIQVEWKEWYNGQVVTGTEETPQISFGDVKPGDAGKLAIGLTTRSREDTEPPPLAIEMRLRALPESGAENGRTEPEIQAGDTTPNHGELQEYVDLDLWFDSGTVIADQSLYGRCDGIENGGPDLDEGTLAALTVDPQSDTWPYTLPPDGDCLDPSESLCLAFEWAIAESVGNIIQGDSAAFAIEFRTVPCSV